MNGPTISCRAPGKLYIAGEYAVVEPGHRAVLVAVDRFITIRVTAAEHSGSITSALYAGRRLTWHRRPDDGAVEFHGRRDDYVVWAIRTVEQVVRERGGALRFFDLEITSELDDGDGRKLGLGSSSAVTVATVRAVAKFYDLPLKDMDVYKLALLATDRVQPIGSGGDIAASAFTGWIAYTSPDRRWLHRSHGRVTTCALLAADWPHLSIHRLRPPGLRLRVGWTGAPASTPRLVAGVRSAARGARDQAYATFLRESRACLDHLIRAMETDDSQGIDAQIVRNRQLLLGLSRTSGIPIETPGLRRLVEIARDFQAAAKSSGAGGGDCGIALCPSGTDAPAMLAAWQAERIAPLDLAVHFHGARAVPALPFTTGATS
ncbi:phosphomevalonate kinase [Actinomyces slackii]|uniref:phosphomevalonate kinase n=1 Tax=Actinomyces slackii TaxID=52774 RepID=A0A448KF70_9ACTO|nr:phosphomevalonate kinase [Actinomyces slackii]VEG75586.1 mevalonate kinase [Actinomyces slackii]